MTKIIPASGLHIPAIAALHVEGWRAAYGGIIDAVYLESLDVGTREKDWSRWMASGESRVFVAEENDGALSGFIAAGRTKTPPPGSSPIRPSHSGELYALYLHPGLWRMGIGTALFKQAVRELRQEKHSAVCLWVLDANDRAKAFYGAIGGQKLGGKTVQIGPSNAREICYGWRDTADLCR